MRAAVLALISLVGVASAGRAEAQSLGLTDVDGFPWLVDVGGSGDGTTGDFGGTGAFLGTDGALLQFPRLCVLSDQGQVAPCAAQDIFAPAAGTTLALEVGDRQIALSGSTLAGLTVTRRIYVPLTSAIGGWTRVMDTFVNSTAAPITVKLRYGTVVDGSGFNELGYGVDTAVVASGSGDAAWGADDAWVVVDDADAAGINALGIAINTADAERVPVMAGIDPYGVGDVADAAWEYRDVTLAAGEQRSVAHYFVQDSVRGEVAGRLAAVRAHPPEIFEGMTQAQLGGLLNLAPRRPRVLLLTSDDMGAYNDVKQTLTLTRSFAPEDIDIVDLSDEALPTLATLETHDVVMCWFRQAYNFRVAAGDLLADYVDGGGDVVVLPFSFGGSASLQGRWLSGQYSPIVQGVDPSTSASLIGTRYVPGHPLLIDVMGIGNAVSRSGSTQVSAGATRVADWADGAVMLATLDRPGAAGRVAAVGFYPVSDRNRSDQQNFWDDSTDGDLLLRNAIYWADGYGGIILPGPQPVAGTGGPYFIDEGFAAPLAGLDASQGHRLQFAWDLDDDGIFGEDNNELSANPVYRAFDRGGPDVQAIALRVTDRIGRFDYASGTINIVNRPPRIGTTNAPMQLVEGEAGSFAATATDPFPGDVVTLAWDFDDGTSAMGSPVMHAFANQAIYDVIVTADDGDDTDVRTLRVTVTNANPVIDTLDVPATGLEGEALSFGATAFDPGINDTLTYHWNFGLQTLDGQNVTFSWPNDGMYPVTLSVEDGEGGLVETTFSVEIFNVAPRIDALDYPMVGEEGAALPFHATVSDPGGDALQVSWSFGDNSPEIVGLEVTHAYGDNGTWTVVATVDDGTDQHSVLGSLTVVNVAPRVTGIIGPTDVTLGEEFTLTVVFEDPGFWDTHTISWDLGPAGTTTGPMVTGSFDALGPVTISVTVTDDEGASDTETRQLTVRGVPPTITAFDATASGDEGGTFLFHVEAMQASCSQLTYEWAFGDGGVETGTDVSHVYTDDGSYNAEVAVTCVDTNGLSVRGREIVVLNVAPTLGALMGPASVLEGVEVPFSVAVNDPGADQFTFTWTINAEEVVTTTSSLPWTFLDNGTYTVSVLVADDDGGQATAGPLEVSVLNAAPACEGSVPNAILVIAAPPVTYETQLSATDVAADTLDWQLVQGPEGMVIFNDGLVRWSVSEPQYEAGEVDAVALVEDGDGGSCRVEWTITLRFADNDSDGIPDYWELRFGLDPNDPDDAASDPDGDGLSNLAEYEGDTNPNLYDGVPAPRLLYPVGGEEVGTLHPEFLFDNVVFDQPVVVAVEVYLDEALTELAFTLNVDQDPSGTTTFVPADALTENASYWWRARGVVEGFDGRWSRVERFRVDVANEPPLPVTLERPGDGSSVDDPRPTLVVVNTTDPDSLVLTYGMEVYSDPDLQTLVASIDGVEAGALGSTRWRVDAELTEDVTYSWRARASDDRGLAGPWSEVWSFVVNLDNRTPSAPTIVAPLDGEETTDLMPSVQVSEIADPDGDAVVLVWQLGLEGMYSPPVFEGQVDDVPLTGEVTFELPGLEDHGLYTFRARVDDPTSSSEWASVTFFTNVANEPPGVPVLEAPVADAVVETATPTFTLVNATDLDRDHLTYDIFVYQGTSQDTPLLEINVLEDASGRTSWTVPATAALTDGSYSWTARAIDEHGLAGDRATATPFTVAIREITLSAPVLTTPVDEEWSANAIQTFRWDNAVASDGSSVLYEFEVYGIEPGVDGPGVLVLSRSAIAGGGGGLTELTLTDRLVTGSYQWRVNASTETVGPVSSDLASFSVGRAQVGAHAAGGADCACTQAPSGTAPVGTPIVWGALVALGLISLARRR